MSKKGIFEELSWRGLIYDATPGLDKALNKGLTFYWGIDPTGESLHIGHLLGITLVRRLLEAGHKAIIMPASGTAMIGDPSGKDKERPVVERKVIEKNKLALKKQLGRFFKVDGDRVQMVDNIDWLGKTYLLEFLRDVGKYMPMSLMLNRESVKKRLVREQGLSYAEFSYQLLQAYDFLVYFTKYDCQMQIGGSDQWGNILAGVDLIRRKLGKQALALAFPLVTDSKTGKKFGKTAKGAAIWLDEKKTHPFDLYQFLINVDDELAPKLIKLFSFKSKEEIERLEREWGGEKEKRLLQKELAHEVVEMVHGKEVADQASKVAGVLFDKDSDKLTELDLDFIKKSLPTIMRKRGGELDLIETLMKLGLVKSNSEARRLVEQKGIEVKKYFDKYVLVKKGKKDYGIVELT